MYKQCITCRRKRLWFRIKKRSYILKQINKKITSEGELCRVCYKKIKSLVK